MAGALTSGRKPVQTVRIFFARFLLQACLVLHERIHHGVADRRVHGAQRIILEYCSEQAISIAKILAYFFLGLLLWIFVDFGTAGGFRISYFEKYGPTLLLFYLGYPLIFSVLIFKLHWDEYRLFLATLAAIFVIEVLFTRNPLVMTFPVLLLGIPLAIIVYMPLSYFPLWFVRKEMGKHRMLIPVLISVELGVMVLTTFGHPGS
jgi:hypothetical protein